MVALMPMPRNTSERYRKRDVMYSHTFISKEYFPVIYFIVRVSIGKVEITVFLEVSYLPSILMVLNQLSGCEVS